MDAAYLKSTVTKALADGLAATARVQPHDCVDYLGKWLIRHADFMDQQQKVSVRGSSRRP
jgi:hypothetical protein